MQKKYDTMNTLGHDTVNQQRLFIEMTNLKRQSDQMIPNKKVKHVQYH